MEIARKTALVTGAARGIGRAVALRLASEGAAVVIADVDEREGLRSLDAMRARSAAASFVVADVRNEDDVRAMIDRASRAFGGLDMLVNNAGGYEEPVFPDAPVAHWSSALDLNLRGAMLAIHYAVRAMGSRGGAIVNIASSAGLGFAPHPGPEYAAAKAALMRLTACLAPLAARGIRVNCICPHTVATDAVRQTIAELSAKRQELPAPLRDRLLEPEEIADAVIELLRDERLAGRVIVCRGGEPRRLLPNESEIGADMREHRGTSTPLSAADAVEILPRLDAAGVTVWIDGGWGVDALVGEETREHADLDLAIDREVLDRARAALEPLGFQHDPTIEPGLPARLVLRDRRGRQVDFHLLVFDEAGDGWQQLSETGRAWGRYPAEHLQATGLIAGRRVRCLSGGRPRRSSTPRRWRRYAAPGRGSSEASILRRSGT